MWGVQFHPGVDPDAATASSSCATSSAVARMSAARLARRAAPGAGDARRAATSCCASRARDRVAAIVRKRGSPAARVVPRLATAKLVLPRDSVVTHEPDRHRPADAIGRAACRATSSSSAATCSCGPGADVDRPRDRHRRRRVRLHPRPRAAAASRAFATTRSTSSRVATRYELDYRGIGGRRAARLPAAGVSRTAAADLRSRRTGVCAPVGAPSRSATARVELAAHRRPTAAGSACVDPGARRSVSRPSGRARAWTRGRSRHVARTRAGSTRISSTRPRRSPSATTRGTTTAPTAATARLHRRTSSGRGVVLRAVRRRTVRGGQPRSRPSGNVYSFAGRDDLEHIARPNPLVERGEIGSALIGAALAYQSATCRRGSSPRPSRASRRPVARRRSRSSRSTDRSSSRPSARSGCASTRTRSPRRATRRRAQRFAYLGGSGTLPLLDAARAGRRPARSSSTAATRSRSPRIVLPMLGSPDAARCDIAWVPRACGSLPQLEQELGVGLAAQLRCDSSATFDAAGERDSRASVSVALGR